MKHLTMVIALVFFKSLCSAQSKGTDIYEFKNKQLVHMLTSIDTTIGRTDGNISAILFRIDNPFGSAHLPETDEISTKYAIAIGYNDDTPNYRLFNLGDYINPVLVSFETLTKGNFSIMIAYGVSTHRKKTKYLVNLNGAAIAK